MNHRPARPSHWQPAPCSGARYLLITLCGATLLALSAVAADQLLPVRDANEVARSWIQRLTLSAPALLSAGDPVRHHEMAHPGVDTRFCAGLEHTP
jgi:hypothetical protein